jgi:hypothetical protein
MHTGEKTTSSMNGAGKTGYLHAKGCNLIPISHFTQKSNKMYLNERPETIKPLEENIGKHLRTSVQEIHKKHEHFLYC